MVRLERGGWFELFRRDAARWVVPEQVTDHRTLRTRDLAALLYRHPPLRAMGWMRFGGWLRANRIAGGPGWVQRRLLRLYGLEIQPGASVGGGFYIAHPSGCVIHAATIGDDVTVVAAVTVGAISELGWPVLGDRVFLGAGCRVIGPVTLGTGAKVGANAVVIDDVDDGVTVVGVPARPVTTTTSAR